MENDDRKWEILQSEYLIKRPWLTARRDRVRLPNGVINDEYYVLEWTGYELCAGVCETGEDPLESARRELYEETGYAGGEWVKHMTISANTSTMTNLCHCFVATGVDRVSGQHLEETEDISVHLLSVDEVRRLLTGNEIRQALMAAPLWKYFAEHHLL